MKEWEILLKLDICTITIVVYILDYQNYALLCRFVCFFKSDAKNANLDLICLLHALIKIFFFN